MNRYSFPQDDAEEIWQRNRYPREDSMLPPEGARPGAARRKSYTYFLTIIMMWFFGALAYQDLREGGTDFLQTATRIEPGIWMFIFLVGSYWLATSLPASVVSVTYTQFTGVIFTKERLRYAKSGGYDIPFWSGFVTLISTIFVFATFVPIGWFGSLRWLVLLLVAVILGLLLARIIAVRVFTSLYVYEPQSIVERTRGKIRCQHTYPNFRRCLNWTYKDEEVCRWHKILREFRQDNQWLSSAPQIHSVGAGINLTLGVTSLVQYVEQQEFIWLITSIYLLAFGITLFADGIMALINYPLSQFVFWAKVLAFGLGLSAVAGLVAAAIIANDHDQGRILLQTISKDGTFLEYGPVVLVAFITRMAASNGTLWLTRVIFYKHPYLQYVGWGATVFLTSLVLQPFFNRFSFNSPAARESFWGPVFSSNTTLVVIGVWVLTFNLCELINVNMRRRSLPQKEFKATIWISFPPCYLSPVIAILVSRYVMVWATISGVIPFGLVSSAFAALISYIATLWIIYRV